MLYIVRQRDIAHRAMSKVRGIRFTDKEEKQLEEFLKLNPMIDFSTLSKIAIFEFIKAPQIKLVPIKKTTPPQAGERIHVRPS